MQFAFGVELFIIIFSTICWLFYTPVSAKVDTQVIVDSKLKGISTTSKTDVSVSDDKPIPSSTISDLREISFPTEVEGFIISKRESDVALSDDEQQSVPNMTETSFSSTLTISDSFEKILQSFSISEVRKVAKSLKKLEILNNSTQLSGKGVSKQYLIDLICAHLSDHTAAIADMIIQVTQEL